MEHERLANSADSWSALAIFLIVALVAGALALRGGTQRRSGLIVGALAAVAAAGALVQAEANGAFAHFKLGLTPLDPLKGLLLNLDIVAYVGVALALASAAFRSGAAEPLPAANQPARFGMVSRWLHWVIAGLFAALIPLGVFMSGLPEGTPIREPLYIVHKSLGMTVFGLVIIRIVWGRMSKVPALSPELSRANRIGAKSAHVLLYVLMLAFPITGYLLSSLFGKVVPFYFVDVSNLVGVNKQAALPFAGLHKILLPVLFYLVILAHILGALKHRYLDKQADALERMTG